MAEIETASLNLGGDFGARAKDGATSGAALVGVLGNLETQASKLVGPFGEATNALKAFQEASAKDAGSKFDQHSKLALEAAKATGALFDKNNRLAAEGASSSATLRDALSKGLETGGEALSKGAGLALDAASAIASKSFDLLRAGVEFGVATTASADRQKQIFDKLTHGQGELAYKVSLKLAGETGSDPTVAIDHVKQLIHAKFGRADTEIQIRAAADLDVVKAGSGDAYLATLEKMSHRGHATERDLAGMTKAGVDLTATLGLLAKNGESLASVEARLKGGKVAAMDFARAAAQATEKNLGGIAGQGLEAQMNRLKIGGKGLFDSFDLSPIEGALRNVEDLLASSSGSELKTSITEVGDAAIGLLKPLTGGEGKAALKSFFHEGAEAARGLASGITKAGEAAHLLMTAIEAVKSGNSIALDEEVSGKKNSGKGSTSTERKGDVEFVTIGGKDEAQKGGENTGAQIAAGVAKGIADNAGLPAAAASKMVDGTIAAGNKAAKIESPSKEGHESGGFYDKGWEGGIIDNAGGPERAAADMAGRVTRAGQASPGSGGAGSSSGGNTNSYTFAPIIHLPAGSSAETQEAAAEGVRLAYPEWLAMQRQFERDQREARS